MKIFSVLRMTWELSVRSANCLKNARIRYVGGFGYKDRAGDAEDKKLWSQVFK